MKDRQDCLSFTIALLAQDKLGAAARRHPDPVRVVAPGAVEHTRGVADLTDDGHAHARVGGTDGALAVLRLAHHPSGLGHVADDAVAFAEGEFGAAALGDPDAVLIEAPGAVQ